MGHSFVDHCLLHKLPVHRLDPRTKIIGALAFVILLVTIQPTNLMAFLVFAGLLLWMVAFAHVPLGGLLARAAMVLPFSALVAMGLPFMEGSETVDLFGITLSVHGLWVLWGVTIKSVLGAAAFVLLIATTPFDEVLSGLRGLGMPTILVDTLALTYRYVFLLTEEAKRLRCAAIARGYAPKWLPQATIVGRLIGNLFLRSYERAERVFGAMRLRGYSGHIPKPSRPPLCATEKAALTVWVVSLFLTRMLIA